MNRRLFSLMLAMLAACVSFAQKHEYRWGDSTLSLDRKGVVLGFSRADGAQGFVEGQDMPIAEMVKLAGTDFTSSLQQWKVTESKGHKVAKLKSEPIVLKAPTSFYSKIEGPGGISSVTRIKWVDPNRVVIQTSISGVRQDCSGCAPPCCFCCGICAGGAGFCLKGARLSPSGSKPVQASSVISIRQQK